MKLTKLSRFCGVGAAMQSPLTGKALFNFFCAKRKYGAKQIRITENCRNDFFITAMI
jgi:hypothetical protein